MREDVKRCDSFCRSRSALLTAPPVVELNIRVPHTREIVGET